MGTPLHAAFSGEAYEIRENDKKLGLSVFVKGKSGIIAIYSHLDSTNLKQGDTVKEGEQVGEAGRSGNVMKEQPASEDHVHPAAGLDRRVARCGAGAWTRSECRCDVVRHANGGKTEDKNHAEVCRRSQRAAVPAQVVSCEGVNE